MGVASACLVYEGPKEDGSEERAPLAKAWWAGGVYRAALQGVREIHLIRLRNILFCFFITSPVEANQHSDLAGETNVQAKFGGATWKNNNKQTKVRSDEGCQRGLNKDMREKGVHG